MTQRNDIAAAGVSPENQPGSRAVSNVADLVHRIALDRPDAIALVEADSGRRITYRDLDEQVGRCAQGLADMGLVAGYRVALVTTNRLELVTGYLAALRARLVAVPVNPRATTGELARTLADSGSRVVVGDAATITSVRAAVAGIEDALAGDGGPQGGAPLPRVVVVEAPTLPGETRYADLLAEDWRPPPTPQDPEALAALLYTSGASGAPRAAMLTHRALVANVEQAAAVDPPLLTGDDVVLGVLPLFHVYGLNAVLGQCLRHGARLVLVEGFDPNATLNVIEDEAVSVLPVAPPVFAYWRSVEDLAERLGPVRLVLSGSAPLDTAVADEFTGRTGLAVHQGYGLTETAPVVTSTLCSRELKPASVGAPLPGVEVRVRDASGQEPEEGDGGEIEVRGPNLFSGYWPDGSGGPNGEGWWATGDVGFLDRDGDLFLVDRLKDLVIVSGFNVYPSEVEEVLTEVAGVAQAAVVGTADELTGEAVVAFVQREPDTTASDDELVQAVRNHCAERLAGFKQPSVVTVVEALPHTATGKVAKGRLRASERRRRLGLL